MLWFVEVDFTDDGGGSHRNMLECSFTGKVFLNCYMCMLLNQFLNNILIVMHGTSNIQILKTRATNKNKTGNVRINETSRRVRATTAAVEKQ